MLRVLLQFIYCFEATVKNSIYFWSTKNFFPKKNFITKSYLWSRLVLQTKCFFVLSKKSTLRKHVSIRNKYPEIFVTYTTVFPQKRSRTEQNPLYSSIKIPPPKWFKLEIGAPNPHPLGWFKHLIKGYDIPNLMLSIRNAPVFLMWILYFFCKEISLLIIVLILYFSFMYNFE